jgi:sRNA-binding protein
MHNKQSPETCDLGARHSDDAVRADPHHSAKPLNHKAKFARQETARAVLDLLAERWPKAFFVYEARRRPLKIGIHLDILKELAGAITPVELGRALAYYCSNRRYRNRLVAGAQRIDLQGRPARTVETTFAVHPKPPKLTN